MSETSGKPDTAALLAETERTLVEIKTMRAQVEEQLKAAEAARKKADEDASYANQAKINAEEHSKSTAVFKGTAEADLNSITTNKQNFEALVASVNVGKATLEADLKLVAEGRKIVEQSATAASEALNAGMSLVVKIEEFKAAADSSRKAVEQAEDLARKASDKTAVAETASEALLVRANESLSKIAAVHDTVATQGAAINEALTEINTDQSKIESIIEHLTKSDKQAIEYEGRVEELSKTLDSLNKKAESFLPDATSTGLAYSFNLQKARFAEPQRRWLKTFQMCIGGLLVVAIPSFYIAVFSGIYGVSIDVSWGEILRGMIVRLPIVIPLVWLAIYSGRNYMLSLRLEEEYAYKEAISRAFEGYKREMKDILAGELGNPTPLNKFCLNVLTALAERPGKIYESKPKDFTIATEAKELLEQADELRRRKISTG